MPQINSGKSPPWVAGEIVTAAGLNGMIDAATLDPSAITAKTNLATLTGDEYALIVDTTGALKKTQLKNSLLTGEDIKTDLITQITGSSTTLLIQSNPSVNMLVDGIGGLILRSQSGNMGIDAQGNIAVQSTGMTFDGQGGSGTGVIDFQTRTIFSNTGAVKLPAGTTAQRPATPVAGDTRFNSTLSTTETYNGSDWSSTALRVAILTREEPSTAGYSYTYPLTPNVWVDTNFNTISESSPFIVNATSFTGVAGSAGTATVTVPAGTYIIEGQASVQSGGGSGKIIIKAINTSTSATIKKGFVGYCANFSYGISIVQGVVTFASQTSIKFQTMTDNVNISSNIGNNDGTSEQVFFAKITKLA